MEEESGQYMTWRQMYQSCPGVSLSNNGINSILFHTPPRSESEKVVMVAQHSQPLQDILQVSNTIFQTPSFKTEGSFSNVNKLRNPSNS